MVVVRVIIVEGPDGAGKTTFIKTLAIELKLEVAPKFVTSKGAGAGVNDLFGAAYKDVVTMHDRPAMIYDRHPMISEYIYGPITRGKLPEDFLTPQAHATLRMMADQVLVIWCLPSVQTCANNVVDLSKPAQMHGVEHNIDKIWAMYHSMRMWWCGQSTVYDYNVGDDDNHRFGYANNRSAARLHAAAHNTRSMR